jgi:16S rRNA (adenine1518-N6/adenine1519-N6)-dimethyltransferase
MHMLRHSPKKSLGQNFLTSLDTVKKIVSTGNVAPGDIVCEIGPGKGVLTRELLLVGAQVIAIEKDDSLYAHLSEVFKDEIQRGKLTLVHADVLDVVDTYVFPNTYKLIANIPYNITGKIISTFLSLQNKPSCAVLMVQYEVAARIASSSQKPSILSISVAVYGNPKLIKRIPAGAFFPKPKVDSAILLIDNISNSFFDSKPISSQLFFSVVKAGFAHKRKKLLRNLLEVFPQTDWKHIFMNVQLDENTRAENITKELWLELTNQMNSSMRKLD